jgi:hypothetical protein
MAAATERALKEKVLKYQHALVSQKIESASAVKCLLVTVKGL